MNKIPALLIWIIAGAMFFMGRTVAEEMNVFPGDIPDYWTEMPDVVCNGLVVKLEQSAKSSPSKFKTGSGAPLRMFTMTATVKVLAVSKGEAGKEIKLRFPRLDFNAPPLNGSIGNGPNQISVKLNERYRFYLKKTKDVGVYTGILDGDYFHDYLAVEKLDDKESDGNPPLFKERALQIAKQYVAKKFPAYAIHDEWMVARYERYAASHGWWVEFFSKEPYTYPAFTADATIKVLTRDGSVSSTSWFSEDLPADYQLDNTYIGREVIIATRFSSGEARIYRGVIKRIADQQIVGVFDKADESIYNPPPAEITIDRLGIYSIQRIKK